jgi:MoaA/NifB/PqqE/SkfB family radical SAM enzyme
LPTLKPRNPFVLTFALTKTTLLQNASILDRLFQLAATTTIDSVNVFTVSPSAHTESGEMDVSEAIFEGTPESEFYKQKAAELKEKFPQITANFYAPQIREISENGKIKCIFAWWYICCDAFGNVSPCACVAPPEEKYGNIFKDSFSMSTTWNCEEIRAARRWFNSDEIQNVPKLCEHCIHLNRKVL